MKYFQDRAIAVECIRLREKLNSMFFGKIYRDHKNQSMKQLGIKNNNHVVVQLLDEPEELDDSTFILLFCLRDCKERTYSEKTERKFEFTKTDKNPLKPFRRTGIL